jgi:hypothetical protein
VCNLKKGQWSQQTPFQQVAFYDQLEYITPGCIVHIKTNHVTYHLYICSTDVYIIHIGHIPRALTLPILKETEI